MAPKCDTKMTKRRHCGLISPLFQISNVNYQMAVILTSLLIDDCRNSHGDSSITWERISKFWTLA